MLKGSEVSLLLWVRFNWGPQHQRPTSSLSRPALSSFTSGQGPNTYRHPHSNMSGVVLSLPAAAACSKRNEFCPSRAAKRAQRRNSIAAWTRPLDGLSHEDVQCEQKIVNIGDPIQRRGAASIPPAPKVIFLLHWPLWLNSIDAEQRVHIKGIDFYK